MATQTIPPARDEGGCASPPSRERRRVLGAALLAFLAAPLRRLRGRADNRRKGVTLWLGHRWPSERE